MSVYDNNYNMDSSLNVGNSLEVNVNYSEPEIRADILISEFNSVRLWGRVINANGDPVRNVLVKLLKIEQYCDGVHYKGVAHTLTDGNGIYQFYLSPNGNRNDAYKIVVSKSPYEFEETQYEHSEYSENNYNPSQNYNQANYNNCDYYKNYNPMPYNPQNYNYDCYSCPSFSQCSAKNSPKSKY